MAFVYRFDCILIKCNNFVLFQFIDLCILLGCDYCDSIRGIGPKRAYDLVKQYHSIEEILKHIDSKVYLTNVIFHKWLNFLVIFSIKSLLILIISLRGIKIKMHKLPIKVLLKISDLRERNYM